MMKRQARQTPRLWDSFVIMNGPFKGSNDTSLKIMMCWPLSQTLIVILSSLFTVLATFARSLSSSDLQFTVRLKITW